MASDPFIPRMITITKLEAARRQLATAIKLWFHDDDPVSIHTLAAAAHEIIHVISRRKIGHGLLFSNPFIKKEYRIEFDKLIKTDANFAKHARDDPDSSKEFNVTTGLSFIAITVAGLARMGETLNDSEAIFLTWARFHLPNWFTNSISDYGIPAEMVRQIAAIEKSEFYESIAQFWIEQRRTPAVD